MSPKFIVKSFPSIRKTETITPPYLELKSANHKRTSSNPTNLIVLLSNIHFLPRTLSNKLHRTISLYITKNNKTVASGTGSSHPRV